MMTTRYFAAMKYLLSTCLLLASLHPLFAQDTLIVLSAETRQGLELKWLPQSAALWRIGNQYGFSVSRQVEGSAPQLLATGLKPKERPWFAANPALARGFMPVLGEVLYDPDFMQEVQGKKQALKNQYNYLVYEAERNFECAQALGLGFRDSTFARVRRQNCRYEITLRDSTGRVLAQGQIDLEPTALPARRNPAQFLHYELPNELPLSHMRPDALQVARIAVTARAYGDSIVLRWAPTEQRTWVEANRVGYVVLRYDDYEGVIPDKWKNLAPWELADSLKQPLVKTVLLADSLKPWPLNTFNRPEIIADSMAMVAAQCLYGAATAPDSSGIYYAYSEAQMRFGFALMAADRSPLAATALGLRFVDRKVKPGKTYRYTILSPAVPYFPGSASATVENTPSPLPTPQDFYSLPGDSIVILQWSKQNDERFSLYRIERSEDGGKTWKQLNKLPLLEIESNRDTSVENAHRYIDSVRQNYMSYRYRLSGLDAFGTWSPAVETAGAGRDQTPTARPVFTRAESMPNGSIRLEWAMEPGNIADLAGFELQLATEMKGPYEVVPAQISAGERAYDFPGPLSTDRSYYFVLTARDTAGNRVASFPTWAAVIDSLPPTAPTKLAGVIDSNGVVTLVWGHNSEKDLLGYRVYFSNDLDHEFSQLTTEPTPINTWRDTLALNSLSEFIFYRLIAEDQFHNPSVFSDILRLRRPDIVPPVAPIMVSAKPVGKTVEVRWNPSPNRDVVRYEVYRRPAGQDTLKWLVIGRVGGRSDGFWRDTSAVLEQMYEYTVRAQDDANLFSDYAFPIYGRRFFDGTGASVRNLTIRLNKSAGIATLNWQYDPAETPELSNQTFYFFLYRSVDGGPMEKYKQLSGTLRHYDDRELKKEGTYQYAIKVVWQDGKTGLTSASVSAMMKKE